MDSIKNRIIEFLLENRMSTEEVSDCLGKAGLLSGARTICPGNYAVGEIEYVYGHSDSNWPIHEQLRYIQLDKVLLVDNIDIHERALFGQLVSRFIVNTKKSRAIITCGLMRDVEGLLEDGCKVWCAGITPIGCFNKEVDLTPEVAAIAQRNKEYYHGAVAVCDDSGVVVIGKEYLTEEFFESLLNMREQEAIWFDCVDNRMWDTYDTVCIKKYKGGQ